MGSGTAGCSLLSGAENNFSRLLLYLRSGYPERGAPHTIWESGFD